MFYLRAQEKDDKMTTPGVRKYYAGTDNKFTRLYDDLLLGNLKKILNIWSVVNKKEKVEGESCLLHCCLFIWKYPQSMR